jgi:hypothetical protein
MPVACDTNARRKYILKSDRKARKVSKDQMPKFIFRYLTRRQKMEYLKLGNESDAVTRKRTPEDVMAEFYQCLGKVLTGWENLTGPDALAVPYDAANIQVLDDVLTDNELWELYWAGGEEIDEADLNFFDSPPSSPAGTSASPAPQVVA